MKKLIAGFRQTNPYIETNIFKSVGNVNLDACIGYVLNGERYNFLESYEKCEPEASSALQHDCSMV